ncbi:hypothetical protein [Spirosoma sp.]|uniref:hypothetical protein n=1 Tax=Spirosoma sp. TaxID=1899569 RepID=UPI002623C2CF|nr:hypothetical protein [Spirosoma sp.]MCX6212831.1 hypothetical protein [Spirosoma sp.]
MKIAPFLLITLMVKLLENCALNTDVPISTNTNQYDKRLVGTWLSTTKKSIVNVQKTNENVLKATYIEVGDDDYYGSKRVVYPSDVQVYFLSTAQFSSENFLSFKFDDSFISCQYEFSGNNKMFFNLIPENSYFTDLNGKALKFSNSDAFQEHLKKVLRKTNKANIFYSDGASVYNETQYFRVSPSTLDSYFVFSTQERTPKQSTSQAQVKSKTDKAAGALLLLMLFGLMAADGTSSGQSNKYQAKVCDLCHGSGKEPDGYLGKDYKSFSSCPRCYGAGVLR